MRLPPRWHSLFRQLEDRGVLRVAGFYAAAVFLVLQVADLIFPALPLPESAYTVLVLVSLAGFPVAIAAAWLFDLTDEGMTRSPAGLEGYQPVPRRAGGTLRVLSVTGIVVVLALAGGVLAFRTLWLPDRDADRMMLAAFPFSAQSAQWSEGVPDLLLTSLDGAESMAVMDPWGLWTVLRDEPGAPAEPPDPGRAGRIASDRGAHNYLLGSVTEAGDRVEIVARLYRTGRASPVESFRIGGPTSELAGLVDRLAVQVLTELAADADPSLAGLHGAVTQSPDALKAYLAARVAMRRGQVDSAVAAVDRAVAIDSTFALAWLEATQVHSWAQHMRGEPYRGLLEMVERAEAHDTSLTPRARLRLEATRALLETDGQAAASALNRILETDSTDVRAWAGLAYCHMVHGWQYGAPPAEAERASERVLALDSTDVPALATRVWLGVAEGDTAAVARAREALRLHGDSHLARSTLEGVRALSTPDSALPALAAQLARRGVGAWLTPYRYLRLDSPDRARILLDATASNPDPRIAGMARGEAFRLRLARGRLATLARELDAGRHDQLLDSGIGHLFMVTAVLVGAGDTALTARSVEALEAALPPDSALAYFETRPVWWTAWALGAYHAQLGDTARARVWHDVIGTFPPGGTSPDYRGALQADIEARLLSRHDALPDAIQAAERAMDLWGIHTENDYESSPSPHMRFHLASLRSATGDTEAARRLFGSLVPPTSWLGFLTARSWYELGGLAEADGDLAAARRYYERALTLWEAADGPGEAWRDQARRARERVVTG